MNIRELKQNNKKLNRKNKRLEQLLSCLKKKLLQKGAYLDVHHLWERKDEIKRIEKDILLNVQQVKWNKVMIKHLHESMSDNQKKSKK